MRVRVREIEIEREIERERERNLVREEAVHSVNGCKRALLQTFQASMALVKTQGKAFGWWKE